MARRLLLRLFVGPRGRGGRTSSSVVLIEEAAGWLDAVCSGSLSLRPGRAVCKVRDRRSIETADGACTIGGLGLRRPGRAVQGVRRRSALIAQVRREVDETARDEASETQAMML